MIVGGKKFTIGADPEIFVSKDGEFVSAHDMVPGDKAEPYFVDKGAVQVDGMALEFNIDPAESYEQFSDNLDSVQNTLKNMIGNEYEFMKTASVYYTDEFAKSVPKFNLVLGCSADFNGWTLDTNDSPDSSKNMRTAGGHIHIGGFGQDDIYDWEYFKLCGKIARTMDETLGLYSLFWDKDDERRSMYGKAGCFRPKPYGMEYRTLSNSWIFSKNLVKFVYEATEEALNKVFCTDYEPPLWVKDVIDNSNRSSAYLNSPEIKNRLVGVC